MQLEQGYCNGTVSAQALHEAIDAIGRLQALVQTNRSVLRLSTPESQLEFIKRVLTPLDSYMQDLAQQEGIPLHTFNWQAWCHSVLTGRVNLTDGSMQGGKTVTAPVMHLCSAVMRRPILTIT